MDKLSFWLNCALSDKSTKIGRGRFVCFELIRCGAIGPWPQPGVPKPGVFWVLTSPTFWRGLKMGVEREHSKNDGGSKKV